MEELVDVIAEMIYDNEMMHNKFIEYPHWESLNTDEQEHFIKVAEEIVETIQENAHVFEE